MMNKEFVPYDPALALKELGFDEPVFNAFCTNTKELIVEEGEDMVYGKVIPNDDTISAPLYQQVFRWFRGEHKFDYIIDLRWGHPDAEKKYCVDIIDPNVKSGNFEIRADDDIYHLDFDTYEEAELGCIKKLIEILKEK